MDKVTEKQIQVHLNKVNILSKELTARESAGRKRINKMEYELAEELDRIQKQIDDHKLKAIELRKMVQTPKSDSSFPDSDVS